MKKMKKLLGIVVLGLLWCGSVNAAMATCVGGECDIVLSLHYEWVQTNCFQTLIMEEVETDFLSFTIVDTGEECMVFDLR